MYDVFGFEYSFELSTKPEKAIGSDEVWDVSEEALRTALESTGREWRLNPGDGAFYGPKIDLKILDSHGRHKPVW